VHSLNAVTWERRLSTQMGGNKEMSPAQHTQQQQVKREELGNDANCATSPRT